MKSILFATFIFVTSSACADHSIATLENDPRNQIIEHTAYTLSFNSEYRLANWVKYDLTCDDLRNPVPRTNDFIEDPLVRFGTNKSSDYSYSGFDRGHLANSRDMARSSKINEESFYMSNIAPQNPHLNRHGNWRKVEDLVRVWACEDPRDTLTIVTGPVLSAGGYYTKKNLFVPNAFYKVVLKGNNAIGFVFENKKYKAAVQKDVYTVDQVEKLTGLDFFAELEDDVEERLESSVDLNAWTFKK